MNAIEITEVSYDRNLTGDHALIEWEPTKGCFQKTHMILSRVRVMDYVFYTWGDCNLSAELGLQGKAYASIDSAWNALAKAMGRNEGTTLLIHFRTC